MCAGVNSFCSVDIGTGSCTLRSKISLDAGLCRRGELDRNLEGEAAGMALLWCRREGETGMGCVPVGRRFEAGGSFRGEEGKAPGMAADVSDMIAEEVLPVRLAWSRVPGCCALCRVEGISLRLPVVGSISPAASPKSRSCDSVCCWAEGRSGEAEL